MPVVWDGDISVTIHEGESLDLAYRIIESIKRNRAYQEKRRLDSKYFLESHVPWDYINERCVTCGLILKAIYADKKVCDGMVMPVQKPGKSKQDYCTPPEFLAAVKNRLCIGSFDIDLAATKENAVCANYYDKDADALADNNPWQVTQGGWAWLNPEFADIEPWVAKAAKEAKAGAHIVVLVPASVGANWWRDWVEPYAYQSFLNGRLKFVGEKDYYVKDCALLLYAPWQFMGHEIWAWRQSVPELRQPESS